MLFRCVTAITLASLVGGCTNFAFVYRPPPQFVGVTTWTEVPEGQEKVQAKVGDVLHLPLGPTWSGRDGVPLVYTVTVNGDAPLHPIYCTTATKTHYVFDAAQAGQYQVEGRDGNSEKSYRIWNVSISE
jgi:hypothetical protein